MCNRLRLKKESKDISTYFGQKYIIISACVAFEGEHFTTDMPADFDDIKWWDWFRNLKATSPASMAAKWTLVTW